MESIGLLAIHSPKDECDIETDKIVEKMSITIDINSGKISKKIYDVFIEMLDNDIFNKSQEELKV